MPRGTDAKAMPGRRSVVGRGGRTDRRWDLGAGKPLARTAQQELQVSVVLSEGIVFSK